MKIAVSSNGQTLNDQVDPRFGRCPHFVFVDTDGQDIKEVEALKNPSVGAMRGAGIQAAQTVANRGASVAITGNIGPNAFDALSSAGVKIVAGASGSVKEAVNAYLDGKLSEISGPTSRMGRGKGGGRRRRR
ncbi:MAG: dinitrogenase iron-molybdenum cofactor biosynthesis protein [Candidatus Korarchaeota archaeon]|nr:dinitrogenase iron-molybdenum cofactor biosynthesis protein [Candidatus Korarchaeota archaeon]NIU84703.1 dinitrogenase iron-molybdenum cofactor biosynthesis protein [Candidatus Thorarchaeota archaeon]NIW14705.1 dinitrogenase iron-molybdenum cofactor biosynthesis protein [Candidatus Thorarchaeota archaeon]NIW52779.1 dinitrogenase iron-molybdenum cofactor biosynthesis protein [Candidatus Korarchaeota archaeon]